MTGWTLIGLGVIALGLIGWYFNTLMRHYWDWSFGALAFGFLVCTYGFIVPVLLIGQGIFTL